MNLLRAGALIVAGLLVNAACVWAETNPSPPPSKEKISYALGMRLGMQRKSAEADTDVNGFLQGLQDVLAGKPTQVKESEIPAILNEARVNGVTAEGEKGKEKVSYAMGMRLGGQLQRSGIDVDGQVIARAVHDVVEGKPTEIQEGDLVTILTQAQSSSAIARADQKQQTSEKEFLAQNAKKPGVSVLPDGLQYRVIQPGQGAPLTTNDMVFIKYRGTFVDGREFDHHDHFPMPTNGGIKGWQDALQRMKVGSKWEIFVPSELGFGHEGESHHHIGPDTLLIYELEVIARALPGDAGLGTGRVGHGLDGDAAPTNSDK